MKKVLILIAIVTMSMCSVKSQAAQAKVVFKNSKGVEISLTQAVRETDPVYKCQLVKAVANKTGTSISLKVVK